MHELSIAVRLVELVTEIAENEGVEKIESITLRIGVLACVHKKSLEFGFELVTQGTPLEGARLNMIDVPITIFCAECLREVELVGIQCFRCPVCGTPSAEIRRGNELDVESIEVIRETDAVT